MQFFGNFVKQLVEIQKNHDFNIQDLKYFSDENENKIIAGIINIIKTTHPFTKIIQIDGIMMKREQSVQKFFQQLLTQNALHQSSAEMGVLE